ncbi:PH domain-containing protein [Muribaculum intestinale]|uniref:PH domain-containing protein n=1 Tax=Muribaculum intestinale TaxID=1796646 RepID=UPI0025A4F8E0|nr:PH domain-containing protein [Muribaculum intestinale]
MKIYRSKIDCWLAVMISGITILPTLPLVISGEDIWVVVLLAFIAALEIAVVIGFRYVIDGSKLMVKALYVINSGAYDIGNIVEITPTRTILSSPAASLDRIAISFINSRTPLVISPVDKDAFILALTAINPDIRVKS